MSIQKLDFAESFFPVSYICGESTYEVGNKSILLNLSEAPVLINGRPLDFFRSVTVAGITLKCVERCLLIGKFLDYPDIGELYDRIRDKWTLAYDATREERHKGVALWRSPKQQIGNVAVNMCLAGSVPLNVGLHREHWGGPPIKEVHTQIVGLGIMQQYRENDLNTLYREEYMAPGHSHIPMYSAEIEYPWHQYETITPSVFMATEMLEGTQPAGDLRLCGKAD